MSYLIQDLALDYHVRPDSGSQPPSAAMGSSVKGLELETSVLHGVNA